MSSIVLHHGQQFFDAETLVSSRSLFDCCPKIIFQNNKDAVASTGESSSLKSPGKEIRSHTHTNTGRRRCSMCTLSLACVCVCVNLHVKLFSSTLFNFIWANLQTFCAVQAAERCVFLRKNHFIWLPMQNIPFHFETGAILLFHSFTRQKLTFNFCFICSTVRLA